MTRMLFAADALLPHGWANDVLLAWDDAGRLLRVQAGGQQGISREKLALKRLAHGMTPWMRPCRTMVQAGLWPNQ